MSVADALQLMLAFGTFIVALIALIVELIKSQRRIVKLSATVCQKILHMGFHSLTLCEDVDLTAFGSVQRSVLYNYQYLFAWENIPGLIHLYSHLFHAVQANMDRANRQ